MRKFSIPMFKRRLRLLDVAPESIASSVCFNTKHLSADLLDRSYLNLQKVFDDERAKSFALKRRVITTTGAQSRIVTTRAPASSPNSVRPLTDTVYYTVGALYICAFMESEYDGLPWTVACAQTSYGLDGRGVAQPVNADTFLQGFDATLQNMKSLAEDIMHAYNDPFTVWDENLVKKCAALISTVTNGTRKVDFSNAQYVIPQSILDFVILADVIESYVGVVTSVAKKLSTRVVSAEAINISATLTLSDVIKLAKGLQREHRLADLLNAGLDGLLLTDVVSFDKLTKSHGLNPGLGITLLRAKGMSFLSSSIASRKEDRKLDKFQSVIPTLTLYELYLGATNPNHQLPQYVKAYISSLTSAQLKQISSHVFRDGYDEKEYTMLTAHYSEQIKLIEALITKYYDLSDYDENIAHGFTIVRGYVNGRQLIRSLSLRAHAAPQFFRLNYNATRKGSILAFDCTDVSDRFQAIKVKTPVEQVVPYNTVLANASTSPMDVECFISSRYGGGVFFASKKAKDEFLPSWSHTGRTLCVDYDVTTHTLVLKIAQAMFAILPPAEGPDVISFGSSVTRRSCPGYDFTAVPVTDTSDVIDKILALPARLVIGQSSDQLRQIYLAQIMKLTDDRVTAVDVETSPFKHFTREQLYSVSYVGSVMPFVDKPTNIETSLVVPSFVKIADLTQVNSSIRVSAVVKSVDYDILLPVACVRDALDRLLTSPELALGATREGAPLCHIKKAVTGDDFILTLHICEDMLKTGNRVVRRGDNGDLTIDLSFGAFGSDLFGDISTQTVTIVKADGSRVDFKKLFNRPLVAQAACTDDGSSGGTALRVCLAMLSALIATTDKKISQTTFGHELAPDLGTIKGEVSVLRDRFKRMYSASYFLTQLGALTGTTFGQFDGLLEQFIKDPNAENALQIVQAVLPSFDVSAYANGLVVPAVVTDAYKGVVADILDDEVYQAEAPKVIDGLNLECLAGVVDARYTQLIDGVITAHLNAVAVTEATSK